MNWVFLNIYSIFGFEPLVKSNKYIMTGNLSEDANVLDREPAAKFIAHDFPK